MKKIIYRIIITSIVLLSSIIIFLSTVGIKTDKFNSKIISQIKNIEPNIDVKINDVSAKLNLFDLTINAKTFGTDLIYKKKIIKIENIKSKISLKSVINNQFAITEISISTKFLPIKDLINFIRLFNNNTKLFIAEQFIENGNIFVDLKLEFDNSGKVKSNYTVNGLVRDGQFSFIKKTKISKVDFIFQVTDKEFRINDAKLLFNNKNFAVPELIILKKKNEFLVSGNLNNQNLTLDEKEIKNFISDEFLKKNLKEITFDSKSNFSFKLDKNFKFKNFDLESIINLNYLKLNNFLKLKTNFPNINKIIIFKNHNVKLEYRKKNLNIIGSGNIFLQEEPDIFQYNLTKNKKEFIFDTNLKISKNPFLINLLNYEKNEESILDLSLKGKLNGSDIFLKKILLSENKNTLSIKKLKLSKNYKINDIGNIQISYVDKENLDNKIQILKDNNDYKIIGNSLILIR